MNLVTWTWKSIMIIDSLVTTFVRNLIIIKKLVDKVLNQKTLRRKPVGWPCSWLWPKKLQGSFFSKVNECKMVSTRQMVVIYWVEHTQDEVWPLTLWAGTRERSFLISEHPLYRTLRMPELDGFAHQFCAS